MTEIRFALRYNGSLRGPEKTFTIENPDPHPGALRKLAASWAREQKGHVWEKCYIFYNGNAISVSFGPD